MVFGDESQFVFVPTVRIRRFQQLIDTQHGQQVQETLDQQRVQQENATAAAAVAVALVGVAAVIGMMDGFGEKGCGKSGMG